MLNECLKSSISEQSAPSIFGKQGSACVLGVHDYSPLVLTASIVHMLCVQLRVAKCTSFVMSTFYPIVL